MSENMDEILNKYTQFENVLKQCIIARFNKIIPDEKLQELSNHSCINNLDFTMMPSQLQGIILRDLLNNIIDVTTTKEFNINDSTVSLDYGGCVQESLIEHYAKEISEKYNFEIDNKEIRDLIEEVKNQVGPDFEKEILNMELKEFLKSQGLDWIENLCDEEALMQYKNTNRESDRINILEYLYSRDDLKVQMTPDQELKPVQDLSRNEFEYIIMKITRNEELTEEELIALREYNQKYLQNPEIDEFVSNILTRNESTMQRKTGFVKESIIGYFIIIGVITICFALAYFITYVK